VTNAVILVLLRPLARSRRDGTRPKKAFCAPKAKTSVVGAGLILTLGVFSWKCKRGPSDGRVSFTDNGEAVVKLRETCCCGATLEIEEEDSPAGERAMRLEARAFRCAHAVCLGVSRKTTEKESL
jgi:hypothetical protein